ncbi:hypothetical protein OM428_02180 [Enterococcus gallinarum]|nr:hypothetical protein [Enterococcus gallinarum]
MPVKVQLQKAAIWVKTKKFPGSKKRFKETQVALRHADHSSYFCRDLELLANVWRDYRIQRLFSRIWDLR